MLLILFRLINLPLGFLEWLAMQLGNGFRWTEDFLHYRRWRWKRWCRLKAGLNEDGLTPGQQAAHEAKRMETLRQMRGGCEHSKY
jgi:hypothetical protein